MKVTEGYVAFVEELPGANTQAETLEEAREFGGSRHNGLGCEPRDVSEIVTSDPTSSISQPMKT